MRVNELSVGDIVLIDGKPTRIDAVHLRKVGWHSRKDKLAWTRIGLVRPIPLTSEILEQNGFKKFNFSDIEGQHQWTWWLDTLTSVSLWCRELNDNPKEGWMVRIDSPLASHCSKVEFLHQLQQTQRLCGIDKEITIKED